MKNLFRKKPVIEVTSERVYSETEIINAATEVCQRMQKVVKAIDPDKREAAIKAFSNCMIGYKNLFDVLEASKNVGR